MLKNRAIITDVSIPKLPKGVRLKYDQKRKNWIVLAPERMFVLDEISSSIMRHVDGVISVGKIADLLAAQFNSPRKEILDDVIEMLQDMADKGILIE